MHPRVGEKPVFMVSVRPNPENIERKTEREVALFSSLMLMWCLDAFGAVFGTKSMGKASGIDDCFVGFLDRLGDGKRGKKTILENPPPRPTGRGQRGG